MSSAFHHGKPWFLSQNGHSEAPWWCTLLRPDRTTARKMNIPVHGVTSVSEKPLSIHVKRLSQTFGIKGRPNECPAWLATTAMRTS